MSCAACTASRPMHGTLAVQVTRLRGVTHRREGLQGGNALQRLADLLREEFVKLLHLCLQYAR